MPYGEGNPDIADGYAAIANEILDALSRTSLMDYESRCVHYLWRKTYGWQNGQGQPKKNDIISYSKWSSGTGVDRRNIQRILKGLTKRKIIYRLDIKTPGKNPLVVWGFQKYYHQWEGYEPVSPQTTVKEEPVSTETIPGLEVVSPETTHGDAKVVSSETTVEEEVVSPQTTVSFKVSSESPQSGVTSNDRSVVSGNTHNNYIITNTITNLSSKLSEHLKKKMLENNPKAKVPSDLKGWNHTFELMMKVDKREPKEIREVIDFSQADPFWLANILSPTSLRAKYDQLYLKMKKGTGTGPGPGGKTHGAYKPGTGQAVPEHYTDLDAYFGKKQVEGAD